MVQLGYLMRFDISMKISVGLDEIFSPKGVLKLIEQILISYKKNLLTDFSIELNFLYENEIKIGS